MSTIHYLLTGFEVVMVVAVILGIIYEPAIAKWEEKKKEKILKAFNDRRKFRKGNKNV